MRTTRQAAARLDATIDSLLRDEPSLVVAGTEQELTATARLLRDVLPRFHPRFGFEEQLAGRFTGLTGAAVATSPQPTGTVQDQPIPFPAASSARTDGAASRRRLGLVAGGAIASGISIVIPLAGAALVVWRRTRSSGGVL